MKKEPIENLMQNFNKSTLKLKKNYFSVKKNGQVIVNDFVTQTDRHNMHHEDLSCYFQGEKTELLLLRILYLLAGTRLLISVPSTHE